MTLLERVLGRHLVQPDQRSCGPSVLVVARMLNHPAYADEVLAADSFRAEVLRTHREANIVWPRALGTTPWSVARLMTRDCGVAGRRYRTRWVGRRPDTAYVNVSSALRSGHVVPIYLGSRWLPRHVVLAVAHDVTGLQVYDPASGHVVPLPAHGFTTGTLSVAGWSKAWFAVLPRHA